MEKEYKREERRREGREKRKKRKRGNRSLWPEHPLPYSPVVVFGRVEEKRST